MSQQNPLPRKKLPIGIQTFGEIRREDYYYVDKTPLAAKLATEGYYASIFYSHFAALGLNIAMDREANEGESTALRQLKDRDYAAKYQSRQEPIHLVGVIFSKETRSVVGFALEHLG